MATLATGLAGAAIGFVVGGPFGAQVGWMAGVMIGGALFSQSNNQTVEGPRLDDRSVQFSTYGVAIARIYGTIRVSGNIIWATDLKETRHESTTSAGGKGGGGGDSVTQVTYSYSSSFAVSLCEGVVTGIRRIWADGTLIYDVSDTNDGATRNFEASAYVEYTGSETQMPDPTIVTHMGTAPAYRGQAYVVFSDFQLAKFGNRIPNLSFEISNGVQSSGTRFVIAGVPESYATKQMAVDPLSGKIWSLPIGGEILTVANPYTKTLLKTINAPYDDVGNVAGKFQGVCYMATRNQIWALWAGYPDKDTGSRLYCYDAGSMECVKVVPLVLNGDFDMIYKTQIVENPQRNCALLFGGLHPFIGEGCYEADDSGMLDALTPVFEAGWFLNIIPVPDLGLFICTNFEGKIRAYSMSQYALLWEHQESDTSFDASTEKVTVDTTRGRVLILTDQDEFVVLDANSGNVLLRSPATATAGGSLALHYYKEVDTVFVSLSALAGPFDIEWRKAEDLSLVETISYSADVVTAIDWFHEHPLLFDRLYFQNGGYVGYWPIRKFVSRGTYPLSQAILDESSLVGIPPELIDVTDINDDILGYAISRTVAVRTVIEQLMLVYRFDAVDSSGKMKFVPRIDAPKITLPLEELAAHEMGIDVPEVLPITRRDETELPMVVITKYLDRDADYEVGVQGAVRMTGFSLNEMTFDLPMVLTAEMAKRVAEIGLYSAWATRTTSQITTTIKNQQVEPTDLVDVDGNTMRILSKELSGNLIKLKGEWENNIVYTQEATVPTSEFVPQTIPFLTGTQVEFMDIVALRDSDANAGYYVAASGFDESWPGCVLFKSTDSGLSWSEVSVITESTPIGALLDPLTETHGATFDYTTAVRVYVNTGALESTTENNVLNGANALLIGDEVIQYRVAEEIEPGTYLITGLLRGRRGSPITTHAAGERAVSLSTNTTIRIPMDSSELHLSRQYRAVTFGRTLSSGFTKHFTNTGNALECLSPVQVGKGVDASGNIQIHWKRRARVGGGWVDFADVPLGEEAESYILNVYKEGAVIRTINAISQTADYSAADQVSDFGSTVSTISVKLCQVSATNGAGYLFEGII